MNNSCSFSLYFLFCFCLCGYVYAWAIHYWTLKSTDILSEHLEGWLKHPRFNFHHYVSAGGEEVFSRQPGSNTRVGSRAEKANQWQKKKKRVIISWHALGVPTFSKGWAVPDDFLRSRHRFPTLTNLVIGCLLPWLQSVDVKWCPRMTVVALLQKLWCNCWHNATNSVISRVCLSFQLPLAVFLQSLPQYFRPTQLAYLLISALVCIQSNTVPVCVCARARQGRPHWTATHLHLSLWKKLSLPWTRE